MKQEQFLEVVSLEEARAILADPDGGFAVRALTRNPDSDKARGLAAAGAEVVAADFSSALIASHSAFFLAL